MSSSQQSENSLVFVASHSMNCNACGSTNLIEGEIRSDDGGGVKSFVPKDKPYIKRVFGIGGSKISAYACIHCSNLQFMVNFSEEDRLRYAKFEGQQPTLLERINEEKDLPE
jgi:hypothetical protein